VQYELDYDLQVFEYENEQQFRTLEQDGEIWFFGIDVCSALDIKHPSDAYSRLDSDDLGSTEGVDRQGRKAAFRIVSESGLYALIFQSRRPEAQKFKRWVTHEVLPQIRRTGSYRGSGVPKFIRRYNANWDRIDVGYFSVISELVIRLWGRLEQVGHIMADTAADGKELRPDVSVGKLFSNWLRRKHPDISDDFAYYPHLTDAGEFEARQYPNSLLQLYIEFVDTVWIPDHSREYFRTRDPQALPYLPKLLPATTRPKLTWRRPNGIRPRPTRALAHTSRPRPSGRPV
jgi:hypothetical protein